MLIIRIILLSKNTNTCSRLSFSSRFEKTKLCRFMVTKVRSQIQHTFNTASNLPKLPFAKPFRAVCKNTGGDRESIGMCPRVKLMPRTALSFFIILSSIIAFRPLSLSSRDLPLYNRREGGSDAIRINSSNFKYYVKNRYR